MNIIFNFINTILGAFYSVSNDYGIAIILLTLSIKLLLMPLSIKQKISLNKQQYTTGKINEINEKYKNDDKKRDEELQKLYKENAKGMLGCLLTFIQLPIIYVLYRVIVKIPSAKATILIPWVTSIKHPDHLFIIPAVYLLATLIPMLLQYIPIIKSTYTTKVTFSSIIMMAIISIFIILKTPIGVGIYFITSSLYGAVEEFLFRLYVKKESNRNLESKPCV